MKNPHDYHRQSSLARNIFRTQHSLPLLNNKKHKRRDLPLHLPQINQNKNRVEFYDQLILSPEYIKISKHEDDSNRSSRMKSTRMNTSKVSSIIYNSRRKDYRASFDFGSRILPLEKLAREDRVVQKCEQDDLKYRRLVSNIKQRVRSHHQRESKKGMQLIYEKLLKML